MSFFHLGFHFSLTSLKDVQFLWQNKVSWLFSPFFEKFFPDYFLAFGHHEKYKQ